MNRPRLLGRRVTAFLLDYLVISAYLVVLAFAGTVAFLVGITAGDEAPPRLAMELLAFATTVLPVTLYFALQEGGAHRATWGKRRRGLVVARVDGAPIGVPRALVRNALKFAPWQIAHSSLFHIPGWPTSGEAPAGLALGGLWAAWGLVLLYLGILVVTGGRRGAYDFVAGTVVERTSGGG